MCCLRLAANAGPKKVAKNCHLGTMPQLCLAIYSQLRHVSTIGKKVVKQQYPSYMSPQYGELRSTSGWDRFISLGHPGNFNGFRVLAALLHGTLVVGVNQTAALNRGRHLYSAGRPSRWALPTFLVRNMQPLQLVALLLTAKSSSSMEGANSLTSNIAP